jgi:type VI secretion system protein ImpM
VGRHFPLTLAADLQGNPNLLEWLTTSGNWYAQLEGLALSVLDANFVFAEFDSTLSALALPDTVPGSEPACASAGLLRLPMHSVDALPNELPGVMRQMTSFTLAGHALWWTDGSQHVEPSLAVSRGLPEAIAFVSMLDGVAAHN